MLCNQKPLIVAFHGSINEASMELYSPRGNRLLSNRKSDASLP